MNPIPYPIDFFGGFVEHGANRKEGVENQIGIHIDFARNHLRPLG